MRDDKKQAAQKKNTKTITTKTPATMQCDELSSNNNGHESCIGLQKNITATS